MNFEGKTKNPWEDENGATNVDGFLKAFAEDDNTFWRMPSGHALNIIDELIDRLSKPCEKCGEKEMEIDVIRHNFPVGWKETYERLRTQLQEKDSALGVMREGIEFIGCRTEHNHEREKELGYCPICKKVDELLTHPSIAKHGDRVKE